MDGSISSVTHQNRGKDVYIWDMDETLILLKSLLDGTYAAAFRGGKDFKQGSEIGKRWENMILHVCDEHFFYQQIEDYNEPFLNSLCEYDDGKDLTDYDFKNDSLSPPQDIINKRKLAYRHRSIAEKYKKGLNNLLDEQKISSWDDLYTSTDAYTERWLSSAHSLLQQTIGSSEGSNVHVVVTSGSLIPSLAKCLLYRLDDVISHDNVYSSWEIGKLMCFQSIKERFEGPNVQFCVVGDGNEECDAAQSMNWPFIKIDFRPGTPHYRFPGLDVQTINNYMGVIYD